MPKTEIARAYALRELIKDNYGKLPSTDLIRKIRDLAGLTQIECAALMSTNRATWQSWESNAKWRRQMNIENFKRFCEALK